jgi:Na+/H+ antiporter
VTADQAAASAPEQYEFLVGLLLAILILELVSRRLRLPQAAAFILGGGLLAVLPGVPTLSIDPDLVMLVFLPPLLMNGGYFTAWGEFRENLGGIALLAIGAVAFTTVSVGVVAHLLAPDLPWAVCFALGAIVSPPDAVSAGAILERLSLPGHLTATLQGESLLNDASGLVLFRFALAAALTGAFSATAATAQFAVLAIGGVAFGCLIGAAGIAALRRLRDSELAILATLLLPPIAYIGGERLGVSGVLATVAAGVLVGRKQHGVLTAATRIRAQAFWKVLVFLLESILFILIGLALRDVLARLSGTCSSRSVTWEPVAGVVAAVIVSRFVWVFGSYIGRLAAHRLGLTSTRKPSPAVATVMSWAGMRGVVTLAAALSLPTGLPGRDFVLVSAFAVILVTVLVQGTTLGPLIKTLRLSGADELALRQETSHHAWARMMQAQYDSVAQSSRQPDGTELHPRLLEQYGRRASLARSYLDDPEPHQAAKIEHHTAVVRAIKAGRGEILRLHTSGELHDEVLRSLEHELDLQQLAAEGYLG